MKWEKTQGTWDLVLSNRKSLNPLRHHSLAHQARNQFSLSAQVRWQRKKQTEKEMCSSLSTISSSWEPPTSGSGHLASSSLLSQCMYVMHVAYFIISLSVIIFFSSFLTALLTKTSFLMIVSFLYLELFAYLSLPLGLNSNSKNSWPNLPLCPTLQRSRKVNQRVQC